MAEASGVPSAQATPRTSPLQRPRRKLSSPLRAGLTRALLLPLTGGAALWTAHVELAALGPSLFGVLALLVAMSLLLPFADLGVGAAVTNAVARSSRRTDAHDVVTASFRLLLLVGGAVVVIAGIVALVGGWTALTGISPHEAPQLDRDMVLVMLLFGLGLPLSLGGRILLGLDRYPLFLVLQAFASLLTLAIVLSYRDSKTLLPFLVAPFVAQTFGSLIAFLVGCRQLGLAGRAAPAFRRRSTHAARMEIRGVAAPMLVITLALPVALQTDRLVLSHVSTREALTEYAIVAIVFAPLWAVLASAGMTLWPKFAGSRDAPGAVAAYRNALQRFAAAGAVGAIALVVLGPLVARLWAGSTEASAALWATFGLLMLVQTAHLPAGMFLTQPSGLRFQAVCILAMCAVNLPLSVALAAALGAPGPVLASAAAVFAFQFLPAMRRIVRLGANSAQASQPDGSFAC